MLRSRHVALATTTAVLLAGAAAVAEAGSTPDAAAAKALSPRARAFGSCDQLLRTARARARAIAGPYGLPVRYGTGPIAVPAPMPVVVTDGGSGSAETAMPVAAPSPAAGDQRSGTNVQEAGVDEPDVVKAAGDRIYTMTGTTLRVVRLTADGPRLAGSLELPGWSHQLLVHGDKLLVLGAGGDAVEPQPAPARAAIAPVMASPTAMLTEVDVANADAPRILRTLAVEGMYVSARQHGALARVVLSSPPEPIAVPLPATGPETTAALEARQRAAIARTTLSTWRPMTLLRDARTGKRVRRPLVPCRAVRRASAFAGLGTLTVLTVDLDRGLPAIDADALLTDAQTVYASQGSLYVATERWADPQASPSDVPAGRSTTIHRFEIAGRDTTYRASGTVKGYLLNQFSFSEDGGVLRVATTEDPPWWSGAQQGDSESFVTVLRERDGRLGEAGRVGGLGRGERIYAVRFIGDRGYVVTFRQTDPLYTLDLADPEHPRVAGELKVPGYSAYLHPAGDGLLLGVGQDATDEGRVRGVQVSLFDVADPAAPRRLSNVTFGRSTWTPVEGDHHAFLYWPATRLAVVPVVGYEQDAFAGAVGLRVGRTLGEAGRIAHPGDAAIQRALVVGDTLYTVSGAGVAASTVDGLQAAGWAAFPQPAGGGPGPDVVVAQPAQPMP